MPARGGTRRHDGTGNTVTPGRVIRQDHISDVNQLSGSGQIDYNKNRRLSGFGRQTPAAFAEAWTIGNQLQIAKRVDHLLGSGHLPGSIEEGDHYGTTCRGRTSPERSRAKMTKTGAPIADSRSDEPATAVLNDAPRETTEPHDEATASQPLRSPRGRRW